MTHFIILPPQKNVSRSLQILGFIVESGQYRCGMRVVVDRSRNRYGSINRARAKKYRYLRFSHRAHVILHIEKNPEKTSRLWIPEGNQLFTKRDPTQKGRFWKGCFIFSILSIFTLLNMPFRNGHNLVLGFRVNWRNFALLLFSNPRTFQRE